MRPSPAQIQTVVSAIVEREGGFVDDPNDSGGATKYGITQATADGLGLGDVSKLTEQTARAAYASMFTQWKIDQIPDFNVFALVADACVNNGPVNASRWLQRAIGIDPKIVDGVIGPKTIALFAGALSWPNIYGSILAQRFQFYGKIISMRPDQAKFAFGWMNRATEFMSPWPSWL